MDDPKEFCLGFERQVNKRISQGIKHAMQLVLKKMDAMIEIKMTHVLREVEQKQECYESQMTQKWSDLNKKLNESSQQLRESILSLTMRQSLKKDSMPSFNYETVERKREGSGHLLYN